MLESLRNQTRPFGAIIMIDEASSKPPIEIVERFLSVSLLVSADKTVSPPAGWDRGDELRRLHVPGRRLLVYPGATGASSRCCVSHWAELVGSHSVRIQVDKADVELEWYPLEANKTLAARPLEHAHLNSTSLVSRAPAERIGGFATGVRLSGDSEFLMRAVHAARVVNADRFTSY